MGKLCKNDVKGKESALKSREIELYFVHHAENYGKA